MFHPTVVEKPWNCIQPSWLLQLVSLVVMQLRQCRMRCKAFSARRHNAERAICYHPSVCLGGSVKNGRS